MGLEEAMRKAFERNGEGEGRLTATASKRRFDGFFKTQTLFQNTWLFFFLVSTPTSK